MMIFLHDGCTVNIHDNRKMSKARSKQKHDRENKKTNNKLNPKQS